MKLNILPYYLTVDNDDNSLIYENKVFKNKFINS